MRDKKDRRTGLSFAMCVYVILATAGSMGAFMPLDRGLFFIQSGFPLNLQITFLACCLYHFALNDPYFIGSFLRGLPLLNLSEADNLKVSHKPSLPSNQFTRLSASLPRMD